MARRAIRIGASLLLMAVLLAWFFHGMDWKAVGEEIARADAGWIALSALVALLTLWGRAVRWQVILRPVGAVRHRTAVAATAVGYAGLMLLPARMGDLLRPVLLARAERLPVTASLATVVTERIFDLWCIIFYLLVFLVWPPLIVEQEASAETLRMVHLGGYVVGAGVALGSLLLLGLIRYREGFITLLLQPVGRVRPAWLPTLQRILRRFLDGLRVIERPRDLLLTMLLSLAIWYGIYWQLKLALVAFSIQLPLRACFFVAAFSIIGLAVPTPGAVGGFHKAVEVALGMFVGGGNPQVIKSFAIVYHAICFVPITLIGLATVPFFGLSLGQMTRLAEVSGEVVDEEEGPCP